MLILSLPYEREKNEKEGSRGENEKEEDDIEREEGKINLCQVHYLNVKLLNLGPHLQGYISIICCSCLFISFCIFFVTMLSFVLFFFFLFLFLG